MKSFDERSYAFVVKIWEERRDGTDMSSLWRGSVEDVQSGGRHYFNTLSELSDYLQKRSGMIGPPRHRWLLSRLRHD